MHDTAVEPDIESRPLGNIPGMDAVKERLADVLRPTGPMRAPAAHVGESPGKLLRPALTLLCASLAGGVTEDVIDAAVAVELIHTASLTHDDVVDESDKRRGRPSVRYQFGNKTAVLLGDYLFTTAFELLNRGRKRSVIRSLSAAIKSMSSGELMHLASTYRVDLTEDQYRRYIYLKTASLMSASCEAGALAAGGRDSLARLTGTFGMNLGMAFQVIDDLLDMTGLASTDGKPSWMDLRRGIVTLPLIRLITVDGWGERVSSLWDSGNEWMSDGATSALMKEMSGALERHGCLAYAFNVGRSYISSALESLSGFGGSPALDTLRSVARRVESRYPAIVLQQPGVPECQARVKEPGAIRAGAAHDVPGDMVDTTLSDLPVGQV